MQSPHAFAAARVTRWYRLAMLGDWLRRHVRTALDPGRAARVASEFDEKRGYRAYHEHCREQRSRELPVVGVGDSRELELRGLEYVDAIPPREATRLLARLEARFPVSSLKKNRPELEGFAIDDGAFRRAILEAALSETVDRRILRHFESEYRVHWMTVTRTPVGGGTASFVWHCDRGPTRHLKLLVYLNDDAEHAGRTEFIDLETSRALARIGYLYAPTRHRRDDLTELLAREGIAYEPASRAMSAGQGILFQPAVTAHRGVSPTRGARVVVTLCLLPSALPWRETLARHGMIDLRKDDKWHAHTRELL
jgi:hypothetical protein